MKLIYCHSCEDIRRIHVRRKGTFRPDFCKCGDSWGYLLQDGMNARIGGPVSILFIDEGCFRDVLSRGNGDIPLWLEQAGKRVVVADTWEERHDLRNGTGPSDG